MKDQLIARWLAYSQKEQYFLKVFAFLLLCTVFYALLWLPVQQGRTRLEQVIPEKKAKLIQMRLQAQDIERLRGQFKSVRSTSASVKAIIDFSANLNAMTPVYTNTSPNDGKQIEITLTQVNFDNWLKWLESLQSQYHIRVQFCQIMPSASRGLVNINAVLTTPE